MNQSIAPAHCVYPPTTAHSCLRISIRGVLIREPAGSVVLSYISCGGYIDDKPKKVTYLCIKVEELLGAIVLESLFGEYHSSSVALGRQ